jgi:hypothetical protein
MTAGLHCQLERGKEIVTYGQKYAVESTYLSSRVEANATINDEKCVIGSDIIMGHFRQ